jgi:hypothetical protein
VSHLYHLEDRVSITLRDLDAVRSLLTPSASFSHVGDRRLRIHTLRGVPGKHCDVLVDDQPYRAGSMYRDEPDAEGIRRGKEAWERPWLLVLDIGRKAGRYDGAERWRLTFRDVQPRRDPATDPIRGAVRVIEEPTSTVVEVFWRGGFWGQEFPRLSYTVDDRTDLAGVLIHQASMYFGHIWPREAEQVRALAAEWARRPWVKECGDICWLNRDASQCLYDLSRNLGWVKLTQRQRERLGLGGQQWQREDYVAVLRLKAGLDTPAGVGQHTLDAAHGERIVLPLGVCPHCHELREDCECVA